MRFDAVTGGLIELRVTPEIDLGKLTVAEKDELILSLLHTAAYWLLLAIRDAVPAPQPHANAAVAALRLQLMKLAARMIETATRVRIAFAASCPEAALFAGIARWFQPAAP